MKHPKDLVSAADDFLDKRMASKDSLFDIPDSGSPNTKNIEPQDTIEFEFSNSDASNKKISKIKLSQTDESKIDRSIIDNFQKHKEGISPKNYDEMSEIQKEQEMFSRRNEYEKYFDSNGNKLNIEF